MKTPSSVTCPVYKQLREKLKWTKCAETLTPQLDRMRPPGSPELSRSAAELVQEAELEIRLHVGKCLRCSNTRNLPPVKEAFYA